MAAAIDVLMRFLIVNPNTSETTNQRLRHAARLLLDHNDDLEVISAPSGVSLIETQKQSAETVPYVVSLIETMSNKFDAVIIAAFSDPGLHEARKIAACPVLGISEAAMQKAATHGPFAIVTLGAELKKEIIRNAELYGYSDLLAAVRILPWTVAEVSSNLDKYREDFRSACQLLVDKKHVSAIIIGGGPLTGIASAIGTELSIPIYDGVQSAVSLAKTSLYKDKN
ncbi:MAG: aspartate/glutamate racemase family protein [Pseudomonadota bacterium]|nr:aspartate/glutamate racemase family protein [Pseudomonadota bacterium]